MKTIVKRQAVENYNSRISPGAIFKYQNTTLFTKAVMSEATQIQNVQLCHKQNKLKQF